MNSFLDNIYGSLFKPDKTFNELVNRQYLGSSFLVIAMIASMEALRNAIEMNVDNWAVGALIFFMILAYLFFWISGSMLMTFTADILGGSGKITDTMIGLAFASLPLLLLTPFYVMTNAMGGSGEMIYGLLKALIYIWVIVLTVIALKEAHKLHTSSALLSFFGVFFLFFILLIGSGIMSVLATIFLISTFT